MKYKISRIEHPNIDENKDLLIEFSNLISEYVEKIQKQEEEIFITALRTMAEPPIKGEITKGKLTWRGIKLIRQKVDFSSYSWLEQRGKKISPTVHIKAEL
jgi:hypothetical protein